MNLIFVLAGVLTWIPKVALNLGHHCAHSRKKWCQYHLIAVSCVYWLSGLGKNKKMFSNLVKFLHSFLYFDVGCLGIDVLPLKKKINRVCLWFRLLLAIDHVTGFFMFCKALRVSLCCNYLLMFFWRMLYLSLSGQLARCFKTLKHFCETISLTRHCCWIRIFYQLTSIWQRWMIQLFVVHH